MSFYDRYNYYQKRKPATTKSKGKRDDNKKSINNSPMTEKAIAEYLNRLFNI